MRGQSRRGAESAVSRSKAAESIAASALAHAEAAEAKHLEETSALEERCGALEEDLVAARAEEANATRRAEELEAKLERDRVEERVVVRVARFVVPETFAASRLFVPRPGPSPRRTSPRETETRDETDETDETAVASSGPVVLALTVAEPAAALAPRDARGSRVRIRHDGRLVADGCARRREGGD